ASSGRDDAIDALRANSGTQFDPEVVESFIAALPSRVPVAAGLFLLLGGPSRLLREIAVWFRRLGAGSLTPAVGATGAAIVLGASIFTPSVADGKAALEKSAAAVTTVDNAPDVPDVGVEVARDETRAVKDEKSKNRPARDRRDGARVLGNRLVASNDAADAPANGNAGGNGGGKASPPPPPPPPEEPAEQPSPSNDDDNDVENPNDERDDCDDDGNAGHGNDDRECDD
ncbi:MAG: hypothetical protein M3238_03430, partial [Actinomycetota bacterium]|nr:hypothetical protein [Actinomycetota bacterium]